jgi:hypothetical protein
MRDVFREQRNAILSYLRTEHKSLLLATKDEQEAPHSIAGIPWHFPSWDEFKLGALSISNRMTPIISAAWDWSLSRFAPRVGLDQDEWSVVNPHIVHAIGRQAYDFCKSTNESTSLSLDKALNLLREELAEGIVDTGEALSEITKRVNSIFDKAEKRKAREIAQTETSRAVHTAQETAAVASGVVTGWRWVASADACPEICLAIASRSPTVKLGQPFAVVGHNPTYSHIKGPPAHPDCNCTVTEILTSDPQPTWHPTLVQPQAASDEEIDRLGEEHRRQWEDVARTWDPVTHEYGKSKRRKPVPVTWRASLPKKNLKCGIRFKFDERLHPRDEHGRFAETGAPKVFKNHEHVREWAKATLPNAAIHVEKMDVKAWGKVAGEVSYLAERFPHLANHITKLGEVAEFGNTIAFVDKTGKGLIFNRLQWNDEKDLNKTFKKSAKTGWIPKGVEDAGPQYFATHEMGHILENYLFEHDKDKYKKLHDLFKAPDGQSFDADKAVTVSEYGATNSTEAFAEAFASARWSKNPSPIASEFKRILNL